MERSRREPMHCFYDDVPDESAFERPGEEESDARVC